MENKILTYDSVEISFDGEAVVHDVSFSLTPGEILGLVGESAERKNTSADTEKTKCFIYIPDKTIFLFPSRVLLNII